MKILRYNKIAFKTDLLFHYQEIISLSLQYLRKIFITLSFSGNVYTV